MSWKVHLFMMNDALDCRKIGENFISYPKFISNEITQKVPTNKGLLCFL